MIAFWLLAAFVVVGGVALVLWAYDAGYDAGRRDARRDARRIARVTRR